MKRPSKPTPKTDAKQTHAYIDALRGLAIAMVVVHHFAAIARIKIPLLSEYGGLVGVQLFFVISGYLIAKSADTSSFRRYAIARVARIFPAYWAIYLSMGVVIFWNRWETVVQLPFPLLLNLLNLQHLDPVALLDLNVLSVSWTLTVEILWYALAPLLLVFGGGHRLVVLIAIVVTSVSWTLLAEGGYLAHLFDGRLRQVAMPLQPGHREMFIQSAFPAQLVHFGWGLAIYWYRIALPRPLAWLTGLAGLASLALLPQYLNRIPLSHLLSGFSVALVFLAAKSLPALRATWLERLGLVSYSVYLLHFPIIIFVSKKLHAGVLLQAVTTAGLVLAFSYLSYRFIELPSIAFGKRLSRGLSTPSRGEQPPWVVEAPQKTDST